MAYWRHENGTYSYRDYLDRYPGAPLPHAPSVELFPLPPNSDPNTLALLRACQRTYRECINIPYHSNIFDIDDPETLLNLRQTIPRQRLRAIKNLRIYVEPHYPPNSGMGSAHWFSRLDGFWTLMWHTIAFDMTGLESLDLIIQSDSIIPQRRRRDPALGSNLQQVRGLKSFQLTFKEGHVAHDENSDDNVTTLVQSLREWMYRPRSVKSPAQDERLHPAEFCEPSR